MDYNQDNNSNEFFNSDSELAKALADMGGDQSGAKKKEDMAAPVEPMTPPAAPTAEPAMPPAPAETAAPTEMPEPARAPEMDASAPTTSEPAPEASTSMPAGDGDLDSIRTSAIAELRPLLDKVEITPEEKFTLLVTLFNANHDQSLMDPAFAAAREITDDAHKAEALLEVIRDINSLSE